VDDEQGFSIVLTAEAEVIPADPDEDVEDEQ
jgi:hypothetical protein